MKLSMVCTMVVLLGMGCDEGRGAGDCSAAPWQARCTGGSTGAPYDGGVGGADAGGPRPRAAPAIAGFDLDTDEGTHWTFERRETWAGVTTTREYRLSLGPGRSAGGMRVHALRLDPPSHWDHWPYLAFGERGIFATRDGATFEPVFDAWNGRWVSTGGLWGQLAHGPVDVLPATWGGVASYDVRQSGGNECEYLPGYGQVCGMSDPNQSFTTVEHYVAGIGPVGYHYTGCTSSGCIDVETRLIAYEVGGHAWSARPPEACEGCSDHGACAAEGECPAGADCFGLDEQTTAWCHTDCSATGSCEGLTERPSTCLGVRDGDGTTTSYCFVDCNPLRSPSPCPTGTWCTPRDEQAPHVGICL